MYITIHVPSKMKSFYSLFSVLHKFPIIYLYLPVRNLHNTPRNLPYITNEVIPFSLNLITSDIWLY